jgi:hypothetical protein
MIGLCELLRFADVASIPKGQPFLFWRRRPHRHRSGMIFIPGIISRDCIQPKRHDTAMKRK